MNVEWVDLFKQDLHTQRTGHLDLLADWQLLLNLPFMQGLYVIVTSIPHLDHHQWLQLHNHLQEYGYEHRHIDYWLTVGEIVRENLDHVQQLLKEDIQYAIRSIQYILAQQNDLQSLGLIACLYHFASTNMQAEIILSYLLSQDSDLFKQEMERLLDFYMNLSDRQKDVTSLAAYGYTNTEISELLHIESSVVAEHLTGIFYKFQNVLLYCPDKHGTRYRLIHHITRLFIQHPYLPTQLGH